MGQPTWRAIKKVMVPEREASLWTPALDYVTPGKLYRIVVEPLQIPAQPAAPQAEAAAPQAGAAAPLVQPMQPPAQAVQAAHPAPAMALRDQCWTPESGSECTADGDAILDRNDMLIIDGCAAGALIAKIGGSTADLKPDKEKVILFSVGRHCVFSIADAAKAGSLYLGINDTRETLAKRQGQLEVTIFQAL